MNSSRFIASIMLELVLSMFLCQGITSLLKIAKKDTQNMYKKYTFKVSSISSTQGAKQGDLGAPEQNEKTILWQKYALDAFKHTPCKLPNKIIIFILLHSNLAFGVVLVMNTIDGTLNMINYVVWLQVLICKRVKNMT